MKRLSTAALALLATLLVAIPTESQAFFGFFGGGFGFGIGSGWGWGGPGWGWGGPYYWHRPWHHRWRRYPHWRHRRLFGPFGPYGYGLFAPYYYPYALTAPAPAVKAPESAKEK
jgi:hypothetical protein